jgi:acyl-homoserine-lactone acylase
MLCLLAACGDSSDNLSSLDDSAQAYSASVRRTEYGIPHINADDWGSLGYGYGYAYSQDNYCVTMREVVLASGRSAELMGEAEGNPERDFLYALLNGDKSVFREQVVAQLSEEEQQLVRGFAAGMNRYLQDTGVENLAEGDAGCRNAPWVIEIDEVDLFWYLRKIGLAGSTDQGLIRDGLLAVEGPGMAAVPAPATAAEVLGQSPGLKSLGNMFRPGQKGSNAIALGRDATRDGSGMLLGNPHQPWNGDGRWYEAHLTIPGVYDVAGASLQGLPFIGIGFNKDLAWTHTVSFSTRFSLYELKLNPDNPMQYLYDDEYRDITEQNVSIQVKLADGSVQTREKTFYSSHFGLIVNLGGVDALLDGWPIPLTGTVLAIRDANADTMLRTSRQYLRKAQASNMDEFTEALKDIGTPVFHELAADRHGDAFYGEISVVPHITQEKLASCTSFIGSIFGPATSNAIITLDGSRSACEWGEDPDSPPGTQIFGYESRPKIRTTGYVGNSNNSYWLSDANNPLSGFPVAMGWMGWENTQQFLRTRITHLMVADRLAGDDEISETPLFDLLSLEALMYNNRVYGAEIVLDDVLQICSEYQATLPQEGISLEEEALGTVCGAMANWDRRVNLDSRGAQAFKEFWFRIRDALGNDYQNVVQSDQFWLVDFDPLDPLNTPRGIDQAVQANRDLVITSLLEAYDRLTAAGIAADAPWGEIQYLERNQDRVPIHGGSGTLGIFGAINVSLQEGGYKNPGSGNSYIQAVTWDESDCPIADTILTHSQSTDPASPHYADQSWLYSRKEWVRFPFCEEDIVEQQIGETLILEN